MQMVLALCVGEPPALEPGMPPQPPQPNPSGSWIPYSLLVPALLRNVACEDPEAAQNCAQLLCTLLAATQALPPCLHETPREGRENCKRLVASCLGVTGHSVNMPALEVTLQLLERCREGSEAAECAACRSALLDAVAERIDNFFVALVATPKLPARILRFVGAESKAALPRPMGQQRCKLLMLFEEAIRTEHPAICLAIEQFGFFSASSRLATSAPAWTLLSEPPTPTALTANPYPVWRRWSSTCCCCPTNATPCTCARRPSSITS